jgi:signal transduction histidine kinase/ActR/RegA family two-component response regulator
VDAPSQRRPIIDDELARRVLVLAPTARDGEVTRTLLASAGIPVRVCADLADLLAELPRGIGALLLTDQGLALPEADALIATLDRQPEWSDVPVVMLVTGGVHSRQFQDALARLNNVTVLERPSPIRSVVSAAQAALRARQRQYENRDHVERIHRQQAALQAADRRKDEFLAMLAHELRNPLAPIRNATELLRRAAPADRSVAFAVDVVGRQLDQLTRLVDDLLDVSRITLGRVNLKLAPVELGEVVAQAVEMVGPLFAGKRHTCTVVPAGEPLPVSGDRARLVQCLGNLLTNAAKYTDPGGSILVKPRRDGDDVVVEIADNGSGIAPELLPMVFDLFVQGERTLDRSQGGLGIGLALVRRLVEMHGGCIAVRSRGAGQGTTVELRLPRGDPQALSPPVATVAERPVPRRVLVVDDNVDAADSLALVLRTDGHVVESVHEPRVALRRASEFRPDVVLLDIGLPELDGYEVARRLRRQPGTEAVHLVALTGYGQAEDRLRSEAAGFDDHLVKPVDFAALAHLIAVGPRYARSAYRADAGNAPAFPAPAPRGRGESRAF